MADESTIKKWLPFVSEEDQKIFQSSTEAFARNRLYYWKGYSGWTDPTEIGIRFNPILDSYTKEYPLPIGIGSLYEWYLLEGFETKPELCLPSPLVSSPGAYAGFVFTAKEEETIGWFIGLVEPTDYFNMSDEERQNLSSDQKKFWMHNRKFKFIEGMILLDGKLDGKVIGDLRAYEKEYNKNILGKVITGRPISDDFDWSLNEARLILKKSPKLKQEILVTEIGISLRAFQNHIKKAGYANFKAFKDSVLKP